MALLFVGGVALALMYGRGDNASSDTSSDSVQTGSVAPYAVDVLGTATVKDVDGRTVPLVVKGEPAIVMISSETCSWCKRTLSDLRELSAGRPMPRLRLLTLEGALEGKPMVDREGLNGVQLLGPVSGSSQVTLTFRYPGTPTFLAVNREGRVVQTMPGYPIRDVLKLWYNVMVGDADVP